MNNRLNIQDIAGILAEKTGKSKAETDLFLRTFTSVISDNVLTDKLVKVKGLGTFKVILVEQRESVHVNTKERIIIPAHYKFSFLPDKELRELVNEPFSFFETTELAEGVEFDDEVTEEEKGVQPEEIQKTTIPVGQSASVIPLEIKEEKIETISLVEDMNEAPEEESIIPIEELIEEKEVEINPVISSSKEEIKSSTSTKLWKYIVLGAASSLLIIAIVFWGAKSLISILESSKQSEFTTQTDLIEETMPENDSGISASAFPDESSDTTKETEDTEVTVTKREEEIATPQSPVLAKEIIKAGDRLTLISLHYYKSKIFWVYIYEYNKDKIADPNNVPIGTEIEVPIPELYGINVKDRSSVEKAAALQTQILTVQ